MTTPQPPTTVLALRVVEAARALRHEDWHDVPMAQSWDAVRALEETLARYDAALNAEAVGGSEHSPVVDWMHCPTCLREYRERPAEGAS